MIWIILIILAYCIYLYKQKALGDGLIVILSAIGVWVFGVLPIIFVLGWIYFGFLFLASIATL